MEEVILWSLLKVTVNEFFYKILAYEWILFDFANGCHVIKSFE